MSQRNTFIIIGWHKKSGLSWHRPSLHWNLTCVLKPWRWRVLISRVRRSVSWHLSTSQICPAGQGVGPATFSLTERLMCQRVNWDDWWYYWFPVGVSTHQVKCTLRRRAACWWSCLYLQQCFSVFGSLSFLSMNNLILSLIHHKTYQVADQMLPVLNQFNWIQFDI